MAPPWSCTIMGGVRARCRRHLLYLCPQAGSQPGRVNTKEHANFSTSLARFWVLSFQRNWSNSRAPAAGSASPHLHPSHCLCRDSPKQPHCLRDPARPSLGVKPFLPKLEAGVGGKLEAGVTPTKHPPPPQPPTEAPAACPRRPPLPHRPLSAPTLSSHTTPPASLQSPQHHTEPPTPADPPRPPSPAPCPPSAAPLSARPFPAAGRSRAGGSSAHGPRWRPEPFSAPRSVCEGGVCRPRLPRPRSGPGALPRGSGRGAPSPAAATTTTAAMSRRGW